MSVDNNLNPNSLYCRSIVDNVVQAAVNNSGARSLAQIITTVLFASEDKKFAEMEKKAGITPELRNESRQREAKKILDARTQIRWINPPACFGRLSIEEMIPFELISFFKKLMEMSTFTFAGRCLLIGVLKEVFASPCSHDNQRLITSFLKQLGNANYLKDPAILREMRVLRPCFAIAFFAEACFQGKHVDEMHFLARAGGCIRDPMIMHPRTYQVHIYSTEIFARICYFSRHVFVIIDGTLNKILNKDVLALEHKINQSALNNKQLRLIRNPEQSEAFLKKIRGVTRLYAARKKTMDEQISIIAYHLSNPSTCSIIKVLYYLQKLISTIGILKKYLNEITHLCSMQRKEQSVFISLKDQELIDKQTDLVTIQVVHTEASEKNKERAQKEKEVGVLKDVIDQGKAALENMADAMTRPIEQAQKDHLVTQVWQKLAKMRADADKFVADAKDRMVAKAVKDEIQGIVTKTRESIAKSRKAFVEAGVINQKGIDKILELSRVLYRQVTNYHCYLKSCSDGITILEQLLDRFQKEWLGQVPKDQVDLDLDWPLLENTLVEEEPRTQEAEEVENDADEAAEVATVSSTAPATAPATFQNLSVLHSFALINHKMIAESHASQTTTSFRVDACVRDRSFHFRMLSFSIDLLKEAILANRKELLSPIMRHIVRTTAGVCEQDLTLSLPTLSERDLYHSHVALAQAVGDLGFGEKTQWAEKLLKSVDSGLVSSRYPHSKEFSLKQHAQDIPETLSWLLNPDRVSFKMLSEHVSNTLEFLYARNFARSGDKAVGEIFSKLRLELQTALKSASTTASGQRSESLQKAIRLAMGALPRMKESIMSLIKHCLSQNTPIGNVEALVWKEVLYHITALEETLDAWTFVPQSRPIVVFGDLILLHLQVMYEQIQSIIHIRRTGTVLRGEHNLERYCELNNTQEFAAHAKVVAALDTREGLHYPHFFTRRSGLMPEALKWRMDAIDTCLYGDAFDAGERPARRVSRTPNQLQQALIKMINGAVAMVQKHISDLGRQGS